MIILQKSFLSGMDLLSDDSQVADDGYVWLVNARTRYGYAQPNKKTVKLENAPVGLKQGIIALNNVLLLFVAGKAYYKIDGNDFWTQIQNFQLDPLVRQVYSQAIPASVFNFVRKLNVSIHVPVIALPDFKVAGTPAGVLVQDGINQPWLIEYDSVNQIFLARVTKNYNDWANVSIAANDREYVPIGLNMMFFNQALYIVAPDKKSCYRSITGRPLDFMVNVDPDGNKLPSELLGGAATVSFAMDFDDITCIQTIDIPDTFVYGTPTTTRLVTADYTTTIFSEPTYRESAIIKPGIVNQYSFSESLGDYVQISADGVKSFNAVKQLKFKGANDIFSKEISRLLHDERTNKQIKQRFCNIINFQNYLLCSLDTYWGNIVAVFDTLIDKWVALDITEAVRIKQYAIVETLTEDKLYGINETDEVFFIFGSTDNEVPYLRGKANVPQQTNIEHKTLYFRPMFNGGTIDGEAVLRVYTDDQENYSEYSRVPLNVQLGGVRFPVIPPVIPSTEQRIENPSFSITKGLTGKKLWFTFAWTNDSKLVEFMLSTSEQQADASLRQKEKTYETTYGTPD